MATSPKIDCTDLALKIDHIERECHARGFHITGHALNAAKNKLGYETVYKLTGKLENLDAEGRPTR